MRIDLSVARYLILAGTLTGCSEPAPRWYTEHDVASGGKVYENNCISCHNADATGTERWKKPTEQGHYPPPPLNGTAHTWHHPMPALLQTINEGGAPYGGVMPPFKDVLGDYEKKAVIAYVQSFWSDDIYQRWESLHKE